MFDEKYVVNKLKSELTQIEKKQLLVETSDDDKLFKEKLFIMFHNNKVDKFRVNYLNLTKISYLKSTH